jgi:hypothetical protein
MPLLAGCSVELGAGAGFGKAPGSPTNLVWTSGVSGNTVIRPSAGSRNGAYLGAEVESRNELTLGSRWTAGLGLGFGRLPREELGAVGFEARVDWGTRLRDGTLFRYGDNYAGAAVALPIWLYPARHLADVNSDPWILTRALELVPFARTRIMFDHPDAQPNGFPDLVGHPLRPRYEAVFGAAIRVRFVSDLL